MKNNIKSRNKKIVLIALLVSAYIITMFYVYLGSSLKETYNIKVGSVSPIRFVATKEIVNEYATAKKRQEASNAVADLFKQDDFIAESNIDMVDAFFDDLERLFDEDNRLLVTMQIPTILDAETGLQTPIIKPRTTAPNLSFNISLKNYELFKALKKSVREDFKEQIIILLSDAYDAGIKEDNLQKVQTSMNEVFQNADFSDDLKNFGFSVLSAATKPNVFVDKEATENARIEAMNDVQPVIILKNQKIVDENEIVTEEIYTILESLNIVSNEEKSNYGPLIGSGVLVFLTFFICCVYVSTYHKKVLNSPKEALLLFTLYLLTITIMVLLSHFKYYYLPISIFPMLVAILSNRRVAVMLNMILCIIGVFICKGEMEFLVYFLITGTFAALLMSQTKKRSMVLPVSMALAVINIITAFGIRFFFGTGYNEGFIGDIIVSGAVGMFCVIISIGSLPLWEAVFDIITPLKLLDLTNPQNPLLRRLMIEAPGTYHHSLVVANLAETAAYDIGANTVLARVGAYYHDVGKIKYPHYFSENIEGENPHDSMEPIDSAAIILSHTYNGFELAEKYNLPRVIKDMIIEHHGTTLVKYFYFKSVQEKGKENVDENDYRYNGRIPQTKESAIVMLADTIEAAVRSAVSQGKTAEEIESLVAVLIKDKLDDGQLIDTDLYIKDLETIKNAFMKVISGMHHDRIAYPQIKEDNKNVIAEEYIKKINRKG